MASGHRLSGAGAYHRGRTGRGGYRNAPRRVCAVRSRGSWDSSTASRPVLLGYAVAVAAAFIAFVHGYEQPALARRYGAQYQAYRQAVPGWWPRLRPARKTLS